MIDIKKLDEDLTALVKAKIALSKLTYADNDYDKIEEELHDLEDDFQENYGEYLEEALADVHDEFCPDNDVLLPIAYLADEYVVTEDTIDVAPGHGVLVEADDFASSKVTLALAPKPTRIVLQAGNDHKEVVWKAS
ncbi:hypothetical protein [Marivirga arenosa]|uniref:Uncharacterized protein n=1 Tax=Marivirga arenosa TaxID=3059076 RepID=A0AA51N592_9BACT|nr:MULTISPECIES: hypothetical protein [unclassified Marivirga]WMN06551.1 hypothetical protein QYS48_22335 [Marivirga sp. ABR2-2]WNB17117.1 hypothetical protein QYS47_23595 [Marivirga sp. BKB1-2]